MTVCFSTNSATTLDRARSGSLGDKAFLYTIGCVNRKDSALSGPPSWGRWDDCGPFRGSFVRRHINGFDRWMYMWGKNKTFRNRYH